MISNVLSREEADNKHLLEEFLRLKEEFSELYTKDPRLEYQDLSIIFDILQVQNERLNLLRSELTSTSDNLIRLSSSTSTSKIVVSDLDAPEILEDKLDELRRKRAGLEQQFRCLGTNFGKEISMLRISAAQRRLEALKGYRK